MGTGGDREIGVVTIEAYHLPGRHDQKSHGRRGRRSGGSRPSAPRDGGGQARGPARGRDMRDADWGEITRDVPHTDDSGFGVTQDHLMERIAREQGFDAKPRVVSSAEFDRLGDDYVMVYRGTTRRAAEQLADGEYRGGVGARGSGYYTTTDREFARSYVQAGEPDTVVQRIAIPRTARLEPYRQLNRETEAAEDDGDVSELITANPGRYGAAKGLDGTVVNRGDGSQWYVMFNRGVMIVDDNLADARATSRQAATEIERHAQAWNPNRFHLDGHHDQAAHGKRQTPDYPDNAGGEFEYGGEDREPELVDDGLDRYIVKPDGELVDILRHALVRLQNMPEPLFRFWAPGGKGGAKIRWGTDGDLTRCARNLRKYVSDPFATCQEMHKRIFGRPNPRD